MWLLESEPEIKDALGDDIRQLLLNSRVFEKNLAIEPFTEESDNENHTRVKGTNIVMNQSVV